MRHVVLLSHVGGEHSSRDFDGFGLGAARHSREAHRRLVHVYQFCRVGME